MVNTASKTLQTINCSKERMLSPDVSKAIAIILVVWGHLIQVLYAPHVSDVLHDVLMFRLIYTVHMPLFMLISGYFFYNTNNRKTFFGVVKSRIGGMLLPILIWNTIHYAINIMFSYFYGEENIVGQKFFLKEIFEGYWFLWAILLFSIAMSLAHCINIIVIRVVCYFVFSALFLLSPCRWPSITIYPFFLLGYFYGYLVKKKSVDLLAKVCTAIVGGAVYLTGLFVYISRMKPITNSEIKHLLDAVLNYAGGSKTGELVSVVYGVLMYYVLGLSGSIFILSMVKIMCDKLKTKEIVAKISGIGMCSMQIYLLQRIIIELIFSKIYENVLANATSLFIKNNMWLVSTVFTFIIAVFISALIAVIINKVKNNRCARFIFGR